jgi:prepilin-type N-terminal cleavage/methylation domain-containing protein
MNRHGFTLIELLSVIVIIGILAGMANLKLSAIRDKGTRATLTNKSLATKPKTCGIFVGPAGYSPNKNVPVPGVPECY